MKAITRGNDSSGRFNWLSTARAFIVAGFLFCLVGTANAADPNPNDYPAYYPLDTWSFDDTNAWTSDYGYAPVSFTNLNASLLGDGTTLVLDSTNAAWLQYYVDEYDGTTNLTVNQGTVTFWFAPDWASTNQGGTGPGDWGRLLELGNYTTNSSYGFWSLYVDPAGANIYFSTQTNDLSGNLWTYLSAPIAWTTNYWHQITLTYSTTNTALYLDGSLATNALGYGIWPGTNVLANGFYIGSDTNGQNQAHGMFDDMATFNVVMDTNTIAAMAGDGVFPFYFNPLNSANDISSAPSNPSTNFVTPDVITGQGALLWLGSASSCSNGTNADNIWITNVVATTTGSGSNATMNVTFTIEGGASGVPYDVFANSALVFGTNSLPWAWMGQGYQCNTYMLTNLPNTTCFLILGTPQDSDGDGLTDAYELLVSHTDPHNAYSNLDGILDGWEILLGLNPLNSNVTQPGTRSNYSYTTADWLEGVSGIRTGTVSLDGEGNVLSASQ